MVITDKIRKKLLELLPNNYRQLISKQTGVHPNTVYNVLHHEHDNLDVALALLKLGEQSKAKSDEQEQKKLVAQSIARQL